MNPNYSQSDPLEMIQSFKSKLNMKMWCLLVKLLVEDGGL